MRRATWTPSRCRTRSSNCRRRTDDCPGLQGGVLEFLRREEARGLRIGRAELKAAACRRRRSDRGAYIRARAHRPGEMGHELNQGVRTVEHTHSTGYYFAPPSHWPIVGSIALFFLATGGILLMNSYDVGWVPFAIGFFTLVYMLFGWFGTVIRESEGGLFNTQVDLSFRWAMSWFIFSEVMFFAAFFGALFYARTYSVPWLGDLDNKLLWPDFA